MREHLPGQVGRIFDTAKFRQRIRQQRDRAACKSTKRHTMRLALVGRQSTCSARNAENRHAILTVARLTLFLQMRYRQWRGAEHLACGDQLGQAFQQDRTSACQQVSVDTEFGCDLSCVRCGRFHASLRIPRLQRRNANTA